MPDIQQRIEQILRDNDLQDSAGYFAELLVRGLGLRRETSAVLRGMDGNYRQVWPPHRTHADAQDGHRYVTEWVPDA